MSDEPFVNVEIIWGELNLPLTFPLSATIQDVKTQLADITGIPPAQQKFKDLQYRNASVLASLDLSQPITLESSEENPLQPDEEIEELEEEETGPDAFIGMQTNLSTQEQFLGMLDVLRLENFKDQFEEKYKSEVHPNFFTGTCAEAVAQSKANFTPLIIYLHYEDHEDTTPFCLEVLSNQGLSTLINESYLFWVGQMDEGLGKVLKNFLGTTKFPFMVVVGSLGIGITILDIVQGLMAADEYYGRLATLLETHSVTWIKLREDAKSRAVERRIKDDQDQEYNDSLVVDELKRKEREKEEEISRQESEKLQIIFEAKEREKALLERTLPEEPAANSANSTTIAIRLLDGTKIQRRFNQSDTLQHVYTFVRARLPVNMEEDPKILLVTTFPRKSFEESLASLSESQLVPQALLIVQEQE